MAWNLDHVEARLSGYEPSDPSPLLAPTRSAVAAVLRWERGAPEVLLMQRATREGDRWSGHVSFPGGRAEDHDRDLLATAIRETREELGVDLRETARVLGRLDSVRAVAKGRVLPMSITPYVFAQTLEAPLSLGEEAVAAFWFPLDRAARGELDAPYEYRAGPLKMDLPSWRWEGQIVWGLTYQMLSDLIRVLRG